MGNLAVALTIALVLVSAPHAAEDVRYGALSRFGLDALDTGGLLGIVYAAQLLGAFAAGRGSRAGLVVLAACGAVWCGGSIALHGHDLLYTEHYRSGLVSKALEVGVALLGAAAAVAGVWAAGFWKAPQPGR